MVLILTRSQIEQVLSLPATLDAVEAGHRALATGEAAQAGRRNLLVPKSDQLLVPMVAATAEPPTAGLKLLVDSPANPAQGLPRQQSTILVVDPTTGRSEAVLDGAPVTLLRTAAASAIATKHLARPDAARLGLVGAGGQAWTHLNAIRAVRPITHVTVWSRRPETAARLVERADGLGLEVVVAPTPRDVVEASDVICTLTPAVDPVIAGSWLRPGQHLNVVGAPPRIDHREVDGEALRRARVVVDDRQVALAESGVVRDAVQAGLLPGGLDADLGEVVAGLVPGRSDDDQITLFLSVGVGIQDVVTARLVVDAARAAGLGTEIDLRA